MWCEFSFAANNVMALPSFEDTASISQIYVPAPSQGTDFSIDALYAPSYPFPRNQVPFLPMGTPLFIKILVPPGASLVVASGQSGSFSDQYVTSSPNDVVNQVCSSPSQCIGSSMSRINGALSTTIYRGAPQEKASYMTLVLWNDASSFNFTTFRISMTVTDIVRYKEWRDALSWAGGSGNIDGIGQNISTFTFGAKPESDARGSVTCNNNTCPTSASANTPITLQATEKTGFIFSEWQCTGSSPANSKSKSTTITVNATTNCIAVFNTAGSGSSSSSVEYALPEFPGLPKADIKLSARVDELPNGGFSWLNLGDANAITTALKDYGNLPAGSSLTMNAAIAPSDPVNALDVYAVVLLTGAGKPDILKQKISSKASFDFTIESDWQTLGALKPYKTVSNARNFSSTQPYSFLIGAGEVVLPKGYTGVMFAVGYQANGTLKATLSNLLPVAGIQYTELKVGNIYKFPVEATGPSVENCALFDDNTNQPITAGISTVSTEVSKPDGSTVNVNRCAITTSNIPSTASFIRLTYTKVGQTPTFAKYFEIKR